MLPESRNSIIKLIIYNSAKSNNFDIYYLKASCINQNNCEQSLSLLISKIS